MDIAQLTYKDVVFDVTVKNGYVAYVFQYNGESYGIKAKPATRSTMDIVATTFNLAINAIESYENIRLREGDTKDRPATDDTPKSKQTRTGKRTA